MKFPLRVVLATIYPVNFNRVTGGVRVVSQHLVQGLRQFDDLDLQVIHAQTDVPQDRVVHDGNVTVHYLALPRQRLIPNLVRSIGRTRTVLQSLRPDLVNSHTSYHTVAGLWSGQPTVYTIHGVSHRQFWANRRLFDRLAWLLSALYDAYAIPRVTDLIAISPYIQREFAGKTRARFHGIDNPVSDDFFALQPAPRPGRILMVGSVYEGKDVLTLLRAMTATSLQRAGAELQIAGPVTGPAYAARCRQFVADHRLDNRVQWLGALGPDALRQAYREAAVVVLPSRQETAPMAILEAMAAGRPVVATRVGGIPDLVSEGETGHLVTVGDAGALADRLAAVLTDPVQAERMGCRGREVAEHRFRLTRVAARYREVYREIVAR